MRAAVGGRMVVAATHLDEPARDGEVLEVHGSDGTPPYLVRWSDTGHVTLFFPGPDARIAPAPSAREGGTRSTPPQTSQA